MKYALFGIIVLTILLAGCSEKESSTVYVCPDGTTASSFTQCGTTIKQDTTVSNLAEPESNIKILHHTLQEVTSYTAKDYEVVGEVKNNGESIENFVTVVVTIYDRSGNVIGTESRYIKEDILEPGETSDFEVPITEKDHPEYDSYTIKVG